LRNKNAIQLSINFVPVISFYFEYFVLQFEINLMKKLSYEILNTDAETF